MLDRFKKEPRMPDQPPPRNLDLAPTIRHDPDIAAAMVSADAMLSLKRENAQLKTDLAAAIAERETWRARCDAKQELVDATAIELKRYHGFSHRMTQAFNDASGILVKIMEEARTTQERFNSQEQIGSTDDGQAPPTFLTERHLEEVK